MVYSMTGFGRGECINTTFEVTVEMKSVNNRYCDIIVKMPKKLNVFEDKIKNKIKSHVARGRVDVFINFEEKAFDHYDVKANYDIMDKYVDLYREMIARYNIKDDVSLSHLTRLQDAINVSYVEHAEDAYWLALEPALEQAIEKLVSMRAQEGEQLRADMLQKVSNIKTLLDFIETQAPIILEHYKARTKERISDILSGYHVELDEARLANELAIYADKTNINEEIVRIHSHLEQLNTILNEGVPIGRKLDFLVQELNREVNTIGSKSPDFDISNKVIELKSEIEQMREQIQNVE